MRAIDEKKLTFDIRNEIIRDLVTHMYGYVEKPTSSLCKFVAQQLILKYTFMRDTKGTDYVSLAITATILMQYTHVCKLTVSRPVREIIPV